jgi:hypothetical protein
MEPARIELPIPSERNEKKLRGAIVYGKVLAVRPSTDIVIGPAATADVPWSMNWTIPLSATSLGLTKTSWLVQPPPSAKCGKVAGPEPADSATTGRLVSRNSNRSLVKPRKAIADTGIDEVKVNVAAENPEPLNGDSLKNRAICPLGEIVVVPCLKSLPDSSVKKNEMFAGDSLGFAMANPVFVVALSSA